jgi:hypothetical protein
MADTDRSTDMHDSTTSNFKRPQRPCVQCGQLFQPLNDVKRFCGKRCYGDAKKQPTEERFWPHVHKTDTCWLWTSGCNEHGYGRISHNRRMELAHRISWMLHNGSIPKGLFVLHRCDNPPCVNPDHLWLGTYTDNARDMAAKGRQVFQRHPERAARGARNGNATHPETRPRGEQHPSAKLTENDVHAIRKLRGAGRTMPSLAAQFGVIEGTIKRIVYRKIWKHI